MLTAVSPHLPVTKSSAERLENGANAEHQLRGQKLDTATDQQPGHNLLSDDEDKINFGPAVVSHLRSGTSGPVPGNASVSPVAQTTGPVNGADDNVSLPPLKSPDRISLSSNARELAYGLQASGAGSVTGSAKGASSAAAAASAGKVEARPGNVGQRAYEAVSWKGPELVAGVVAQPVAQNALKTLPGAVQGTLPGITPNVATNAAPNATVGATTGAATGAARFYKAAGNESAVLVERIDEQATALSALGNVRGEIESARVEAQDLQGAVVDAASATEAAAETGETGFGKSVRNFFHNLRSRLWGQAVTAYSQPPTETVRGQRLHIQV